LALAALAVLVEVQQQVEVLETIQYLVQSPP
jgi:hypothetical protein